MIEAQKRLKENERPVPVTPRQPPANSVDN
jgi:hypothetical protein